MTTEPIPRTLYRRPSSPKSSFLLCLPDGKCWCLSPVWSLPKQENPPTWTPTPADVEMWQIVASNLTDEEIASLDSPEGREERVSALVASRTLGAPSASPHPTPRTLYTHPDKCAMVCLGDGSGWLVPDQPRTVGGWEIFPGDMEGRSPALFGLTDDEILRLCRAEDLTTTIAEIKAARCLQEAEARRVAAKAAKAAEPAAARKPTPDGCDEAEVERWRKAAERAEIDRREWQALALNHEGAIERLTRDLAEARETRDRALYAERAAGSRADAAEAEVERLRQVIVGLAAKIAGVRWLTAENPDPR